MAIFLILLGAALLIGGGFILYYSVQSIRQGGVLNRPVPLIKLKNYMDKPVAVHGEPELVAGEDGPYRFPVMWFCQKDQVYRRSGKSNTWVTVDTRERAYNFYLHFPRGGRIYVRNKPTEMHGKGKKIDKEGLFARNRTVHEWFPLSGTVTVLGKVSLTADGGTLLPDPKLGMVLTHDEPEEAASKEYTKGWGGIAGVAMGAIVYVLIVAAVLS